MSGGGSGKNGADANILNGENARRDEWARILTASVSLCRFPGWLKVSWGAPAFQADTRLRLPFFP